MQDIGPFLSCHLYSFSRLWLMLVLGLKAIMDPSLTCLLTYVRWLSTSPLLLHLPKSYFWYYSETRMHSSRMRTVRCSGRLREVCLPKGCLPKVGSVQGRGVCLGDVCPGGCLPRGQTDACENITFPQLPLRTVTISYKFYYTFNVSNISPLFVVAESSKFTSGKDIIVGDIVLRTWHCTLYPRTLPACLVC